MFFDCMGSLINELLKILFMLVIKFQNNANVLRLRQCWDLFHNTDKLMVFERAVGNVKPIMTKVAFWDPYLKGTLALSNLDLVKLTQILTEAVTNE